MLIQPGMLVPCLYNPDTQEAEAGGSPGLHTELKSNVNYSETQS